MKEQIFELVKELERLEHTLDFTVFYSFAEFMESNYFCPAFEVDAYYYEIQRDRDNNLVVLRWYGWQKEGDILSSQEIENLIQELKGIEAVKDIPTHISAFKRKSSMEDAIAIWFKLNYDDVELYSLTIEDAYRTPSCSIVNEEELELFLKNW